MDKKTLIAYLKDGLIISCQALKNEPLHGEHIMQKMALAAKQGGCHALRMNSKKDIIAARKLVDIPIIGIVKKQYEDSPIYITPTPAEIDEIAQSGAEIVAIDMTHRKRPSHHNLKDLVTYAHQRNLLVMADIAQFSEAKTAIEAGADFLGTTLSGYTEDTKGQQGSLPDFELMQQLVQTYDIPIIAEGRIHTPAQAITALKLGCHGVVVGSKITRPQVIARDYGDAFASWRKRRKSYVIAVDMGATNMRFAIVDFDGTIHETHMTQTQDCNSAGAILSKLNQEISSMRSKTSHPIKAIGIACAGQINPKTGEVVQATKSIKGWKGAKIKEAITHIQKLPCAIENDANAALMGEIWKYESKINNHTYVMLTLGTGLGCGIGINNKILHGKDFMAGNFGQMQVYNMLTHQYESLEHIVSGTGLYNIAKYYAAPFSCGLQILQACAKGDKQATEIVEFFAQYMARLLHMIHITINPEKIFISGGVSQNYHIIQPYVTQYLQEYDNCKPSIHIAKTQDKAGIFGAAYLALCEV